MNKKSNALFFLGYDARKALSDKQLEELKENNIYTCSTPWGRQSAGVIECFLENNSIGSSIAIGFCGGVNENLEVGDVLIAKEAVYCNSLAYSNKELANNVLSSLRACNAYLARTETIDSIEIENRHFLERLKAKRVDAIEMETFRLFAKSNKLKKPTASVLIVSDIPDGNIKDSIRIPKEAYEKVPKLADICADLLDD